MVFSSLVFIYLFLPAFIAGLFIFRNDLRKTYIIACSLIFAGWASVSYLLVIIGNSAFNYFAGRWIGKNPKSSDSRKYLIISIIVNILFLAVFKYAVFITGNLNILLQLFGGTGFTLPKILLPLGISFYTFRSISYLVDVYRRNVEPELRFINYFHYILYFPVLAAGPIIRYKAFAAEAGKSDFNRSKYSAGIERIILGLARKVLIANQLSLVSSKILEISGDRLTSLNAWLAMIFFTLQIYHDFAAYSDIAIGLCKMCGITCPENFDFPLTARSVKDFWNKWHITLSNWLRDYLFLPRAYASSRRLKDDKYLNIKTEYWIYAEASLITFLICGLWHGANWNFVAWGLYQALFLIIERTFLAKLLSKIWNPLRHIYALLVIICGFVLFRSANFTEAAHLYKVMFSFSFIKDSHFIARYYLNPEILIVTVIAVLSSTKLFLNIGKFLRSKCELFSPGLQKSVFQFSTYSVLLFYTVIMFISTLYMIANTYNPFIYFKF
ncbi:MAG: hypothetical protein NTW49_05580 [Bacteroidia bacterium]|nr:hypothetical protein [Bacteroidia bacterium]